jgi:hypothetical protein
MPIYLGGSRVDSLKLGGTNIGSGFLGTVQVFGAEAAPPPTGDPSDVSDLLRWWDATAAAGLSDGDRVNQIDDLSGTAEHLVSDLGGNTRPTWHTGQINGLPALRFLHTEKRMLNFANLGALTAAEIFVVGKIDADPPPSDASSGFWYIQTPTDAGADTHYPFTDGNIYDAFGSTVRKSTGNPSQDLTAWHLYNVRSAAGDWSSHHNGVEHYSTATNTVGFGTARHNIGQSTRNFFNLTGWIAEVFIYSRVLTAAERADVHDYLTGKYGLSI